MEKIKDINRLNDVFFKSLLGDEARKNLTLNFLNSILNRDEHNYFTDINFMDKQQVPDINEGKAPELDILAKTNNGSLINIEIQIASQKKFSKRALYYWSRLYAYQLGKGHHYRELKPTISINLLNFNHLPYKTYHNSYHIRNDETNDILIDDFEMHFIELEKFKFSDIKKMRNAENWIAYFSPQCTDEEREVIAMNNPAIKEALNYEMMFSQDEIKRRDYELQEKAIRDYLSNMYDSKQEGIQEGIQSERKTIAINLLKANMPIDFISQNTGLSEQEILYLQQSLDK